MSEERVTVELTRLEAKAVMGLVRRERNASAYLHPPTRRKMTPILAKLRAALDQDGAEGERWTITPSTRTTTERDDGREAEKRD